MPKRLPQTVQQAAPDRPAPAGSFSFVACGEARLAGRAGSAGLTASRRRSLRQLGEHAGKEALAERLLAAEGMGEGLAERVGGKLGERLVDGGPGVHEVEFRHGGYEYNYDIDVNTCNIVEWDKDFDD